MNFKEQPSKKKDGYDGNQLQYLVLKSQSTKLQEKSLKKILKLLEKDEWILDMGVYSNVNMKSMVINILQAKSLKIWLGYNARPQILIDICSIDFPNLKELSLAHNQIHSIEAFAFLNLPRIEEIQFRQNIITSIQALKKLNLPELKVISFYRNFIGDLSPFSSICAKNLKTIWVQYEDDELVQGQSLSWISKLQSSQLKSIAVATAERIRENVIEKSISRRFTNLKVFKSLKQNS